MTGRYFGFPRACVVDGVWHIKYLSGRGSGKPGTHQLPPEETRVITWNPCVPDSVTDLAFARWNEVGPSALPRRRPELTPLLADGGAVHFARENGWSRPMLGGPAIATSAERGWLWPVYGVRRGSKRSEAVLLWSPSEGGAYQVGRVFSDPTLELTELGGTTLPDGRLLVVARRGRDFESSSPWWLVSADGASIEATGELPEALHWPQLCDTGAHGVVLVGRGREGLVMYTWLGGDWDARRAVLARPAGWWGNAGYAAIAFVAPDRLRLVSYGSTLPGSEEASSKRIGEADFPGLFVADVLLAWSESQSGRIRAFHAGDARVANGRLEVSPDIRAIRRIPLSMLGEESLVASVLFGGQVPDLLDYDVVVGD